MPGGHDQLASSTTNCDRSTLDSRHCSAYQTWLLADAACWPVEDRTTTTAAATMAVPVAAVLPAIVLLDPEQFQEAVETADALQPASPQQPPSSPHAPLAKPKSSSLASALAIKRSKSAPRLDPRKVDKTAGRNVAQSRPSSPSSVEIERWRSFAGRSRSVASTTTLRETFDGTTLTPTLKITTSPEVSRTRSLSATPDRFAQPSLLQTAPSSEVNGPPSPHATLVRRPSFLARMLGRKRSKSPQPAVVAPALLPLPLVPDASVYRPAPADLVKEDCWASSLATSNVRSMSKRGIERPFPDVSQRSPHADLETPRSNGSDRSCTLFPSADCAPLRQLGRLWIEGTDDQHVARYRDLLGGTLAASSVGEQFRRPSVDGSSIGEG